MDEGSRAAVDNFLEVTYRRKSNVRMLPMDEGTGTVVMVDATTVLISSWVTHHYLF